VQVFGTLELQDLWAVTQEFKPFLQTSQKDNSLTLRELPQSASVTHRPTRRNLAANVVGRVNAGDWSRCFHRTCLDPGNKRTRQ